MDGTPEKILIEIEYLIEQKDYTRALSTITGNITALLSSPDVKHVLSIVRKIPPDFFVTPMHKLFKGWICFLCGENLLLSQVFDELGESELGNAEESSIFYSLKAISSFMRDPAAGLRYARLSVDILDSDPDNFFYANARLTYGQLLSGAGDIRKAANEFYAAYHIFRKNKSYFPAAVSLVNYGLKKHAMGEISEIITFFRSELAACSGIDGGGIFNLLKLPLGIAFFELNKQSMAVDYLESVSELIYSLDFVHMFGVLEMHLACAYAAAGSYGKAYDLIDKLSCRLANLNDNRIKSLCSALRIQINILDGSPVRAEDKEPLEVEYLVNGSRASSGTLMALARLKLSGKTDNFDIKDLVTCHQSLESAPNVPLAQSAALLIAEHYYQSGETECSREYLCKAAGIFESSRMSVRFLLEKAACLPMLKDIDSDIYRLVNQKPDDKTEAASLLTQREKEILSLISQGFSNEDISKRLYIGTGTTKWHINNIFSKLDSKRRSQAVAQAKKLGLL